MGGPSAKEDLSAKFELTWCFMLCFTEGLFILHTKDVTSVFLNADKYIKSFKLNNHNFFVIALSTKNGKYLNGTDVIIKRMCSHFLIYHMEI